VECRRLLHQKPCSQTATSLSASLDAAVSHPLATGHTTQAAAEQSFHSRSDGIVTFSNDVNILLTRLEFMPFACYPGCLRKSVL
jgi:hypothetical protein